MSTADLTDPRSSVEDLVMVALNKAGQEATSSIRVWIRFAWCTVTKRLWCLLNIVESVLVTDMVSRPRDTTHPCKGDGYTLFTRGILVG